MFDVRQARAQVEALQSDDVVISKRQLLELLADNEVGQHAQRALVNIRTLVNFGAVSPAARA